MVLTYDEVIHLKGQISMSLANLLYIHAFWSAPRRRFYARTVVGRHFSPDACYKPCRGRGGAVPRDAVHLGVFEVGAVTPDQIIEEIDENWAARMHRFSPAIEAWESEGGALRKHFIVQKRRRVRRAKLPING